MLKEELKGFPVSLYDDRNNDLAVYSILIGSSGALMLMMAVYFCCKCYAADPNRLGKPSFVHTYPASECGECSMDYERPEDLDKRVLSPPWRDLRRQKAFDEGDTLESQIPHFTYCFQSSLPNILESKNSAETDSLNGDSKTKQACQPRKWSSTIMDPSIKPELFRPLGIGAFSIHLSNESIPAIDCDGESVSPESQKPETGSTSPPKSANQEEVLADIHSPPSDPLFLVRTSSSGNAKNYQKLIQTIINVEYGESLRPPSASPEDLSLSEKVSSPEVTKDECDGSASPGSQDGRCSAESGELADRLELRRKDFQKMLSQESSQLSDEDQEPESKVRYNDTGSLEQVNEECIDLLVEDIQLLESSKNDNKELLMVQSRELWELRASLEESFEVHESPSCSDSNISQIASQVSENASHAETPNVEADHPNLPKRIGRLYRRQQVAMRSAGNSFDSAETEGSTDCFQMLKPGKVNSQSADHIDGKEGPNSKLRQMQSDSGYKSIEGTRTHKMFQTSLHRSLDEGINSFELCPSAWLEVKHHKVGVTYGTEEDTFITLEDPHKPSLPDNVPKLQSGKLTKDSSHESDSDYSVYLHSFDESMGSQDFKKKQGKRSLLSRFFQKPAKYQSFVSRDFSIDEKSDNLFKEFSKVDPAFDPETIAMRLKSKVYSRRRYYYSRYPESETGSPRSVRRKLSPQDSIEEEDTFTTIHTTSHPETSTKTTVL